MIIRVPTTTSRLVCQSKNAIRSDQLLESFVSRIAGATRGFASQHGAIHTLTRSAIQNQLANNSAQRRFKSKTSKLKKIVENVVPETHPKAPLRDNIPRRFEELPEDYTDEVGLPYTPVLPSQEVVDHVFGEGFDVDKAHHVFAVLHGRRVAGTLEDPSLPSPVEGLTPSQYLAALDYLRKHIAVNELVSAGKRAEVELAEMEKAAIARGEEIGLYKPEVHVNQTGIKLPSALENIRELKRLEWEAKAAALEKKRTEELEKYKNTPAGQLAVFDERGVELRRPGENAKLKKYIEDMQNDVPSEPPSMSAFSRLWPSALVTLAVLGGSFILVTSYTPPAPGTRMFPEIPYAAATVGAIIAVNALVCVLWRFPPAWKMLNRHFLLLPGYPRAFAVLGNVFSQQTFGHLAVNMAILGFIGTRLADEIGRANFIALYVCAGTLASMASLTTHVLCRNFHVSSLGASTAVYGVAAAYFWRHWDEGFRLLGILPPEPLPPMAGWFALGLLVAGDIWRLRKGPTALLKTGNTSDHIGHVGGAVTGIVGMGIIQERERQRKARMRREKSWLDKTLGREPR